MALIKCPACNRKVSTDATSCPGCGDPLTPVALPKQNAKAKTSGGTSFLKTAFYVVGWGLFGLWLFSDDTEEFLGTVAALTGIDLRTTAKISKTYEVTATTLNQRSCGSPTCRVVGKLSKGDIVRAYDVDGRWVRVSASDSAGTGQWVSADYLREDAPNEPAQPSVTQVALDAALDKISKSPLATATASSNPSPSPKRVAKFYQTDQPNCEYRYDGTAFTLSEISWSGDCKDGRADGFGTLQLTTTRIDTGESGTRMYVGDLKAGARHGRGTISYPDGARYAGGWQDNQRSGEGEYTWPNGDKFAGNWRNDKQNGPGQYLQAKSGNQYAGNYKDGRFHGEGIYQWGETGNRYEGAYTEGKRTGKGTLYYKKSGNRYEGDFLNGKRHGYGTFYSARGRIAEHEGYWENDQRNGAATIQMKGEQAKNIIKGNYKDDLAHGETTVTYPDGSRWVINYQNGKMASERKYNADGSVVVDAATAANRAIDAFRFAQNSCGNPRMPDTLSINATGNQVSRYNASNNRWRDCNRNHYDENQRLIRQLVTGPLKGSWENKPNSKYEWSVSKACQCFDRVKHLIKSNSDIYDAYKRINESLNAAIRRDNAAIAQRNAAANQARTYYEAEQTINAWRNLQQQTYSNTWGGYAGPSYRAPSSGLGGILSGTR